MENFYKDFETFLFVDDELPEYIMVMIANKRTKVQMVEDLHLFLNADAQKFVNW